MLTPSWLDGLGLGDAISAESLEGGDASETFRVRTSLGRSAVVTTQTDLPPDLYAVEADGLDALRSGGFAVPEVLRVTPTFIVLSDLGASSPSATYWEAAGRALAVQHTADKFGYHEDNYLGVLPQRTSGRPTATPSSPSTVCSAIWKSLNCYNALSAADRHRLERVANRLPERSA